MNNVTLQDTSIYRIQCLSLFTKITRIIKYSLTDTNDLHLSIAAYINIIFALPTALLNLSLIIVFFKSKLQKKLSNIPITFLASWDLLMSLFSQPVFAAFLFELKNRRLHCAVFTAVSYVGQIAAMTSSMIVLVITTERYVAIFYAFFWRSKVSTRMLVIPLSMIWLPSFVFCIFMFDMDQVALASSIFALFTVLALIWITFCYIKMYIFIRQMQRCIANEVPVANNEDEANKRKQARLTRYSSIIIATFLIFNIPFSLFSMIFHSGVTGDGSFLKALEWYMITFTMLNSFVNPIVYAWQCPQIGRGMLELWRLRKP